MLASSSFITRRVGCAHPVSLRSLGTSGADVLRRHHQARSFRFGRAWPSFFEDEPQRDDIYRRCRRFRYKYTELLNQRPDGGKQSRADDAKCVHKRIIDDHQHPRGVSHRSGKNSRHLTAEETLDNPDGVRPGQNIEDAERAPLEHWLFGDRPRRQAYNYLDNWDLPLPKYGSLRRLNRAKHFNSESSIAPDASIVAEPSPEYVIDPITNRKVAAKASTGASPEKGAEPPVKGSKSYKSQFSSLSPPAFEDSPTPSSAAAKVLSKPLPDLSSVERQPILESDRYVAELNDIPVSNLLDALSETHQRVSWHPSITPSPIAQTTKPWTPEYDINGHRAHGKDGQVLAQQSDASSSQVQYSDLDQYHAVRHLEPNGKVAEQDIIQEYDDLGEYGALRSHEPDGKYKFEGDRSVALEEPKYYEPFRSCEPDGKYAAAYAEPKLDPSELAQYRQPYMSHEPDGIYAGSDEISSAEDAELPEYEPFRSHEPDGKYADNNPVPTVSTSELKEYASALAHELDGNQRSKPVPESDPEELQKYQAFRSHEPDGSYAAQARPSEEDADLGNHEAFSYEDAEVTRSPTENQVPKELPEEGFAELQLDELQKYNAVHYNELDGKLAELKEANETVFDYDLKAAESEDGSSDKTYYRKTLESIMSQSAAESDAIDADTSASLRSSKERRNATEPTQSSTLTGNYVRDFPEEFARSWSTHNSDSESTLLLVDINKADTVNPQVTEHVTVKPANALEPALDRHRNKHEQGSTVESASANTEGSLPPTKNVASASTVPTLYKVLVYDPTMQCIDVAETTSVVPDSSTPLTPAEVLLRISNPAKFLPLFGPLQAQGFEIVSGAGDILIFRKVREAVPQTAQSDTLTAPAAAPTISRPAINPIDMTGGPRDYTIAADRFASPTGFVNYDLPPPRFKSNIDVRREEPVFSGSKEQPNREGKKSLPKRLAIGALWVAGASYSLGVVGEYFRTGGTDGKGPKGL